MFLSWAIMEHSHVGHTPGRTVTSMATARHWHTTAEGHARARITMKRLSLFRTST